MSKLVKGVKKLVSGVKKVFKKITHSTIGKVLLGAALIYMGGVAFGAWGQGMPGFGALGGKAAAVGAQSAGAEAAGTSLISAAPVSKIAALEQAAANTLAKESIRGAVNPLSKILTGVRSAGSKVGGWMQNNQLTSAVALQGIQSALSPSEEDVLKSRRKEDAKRWLGGEKITVGISPGGR